MWSECVIRGTNLLRALLSFGLSSFSAPGKAAGDCHGDERCPGCAGIPHRLQWLLLLHKDLVSTMRAHLLIKSCFHGTDVIAETLVHKFFVIRHEKDNNLITSCFSLKLTGGLFQIYRYID